MRRDALKVKELIAKLSQFDPEEEVFLPVNLLVFPIVDVGKTSCKLYGDWGKNKHKERLVVVYNPCHDDLIPESFDEVIEMLGLNG